MERLGMGSRRACYAVPGTDLCVKCYRSEDEIAEGQHPDGEFRPLRDAVIREIRQNRNSDAENTSCQEWRYYLQLKRRLPPDLMAAFPETLERVFVPSRGWCLVESRLSNADGTAAKGFPDAFAEARGRHLRERLVESIESFFRAIAKEGVRFYDPQNTIVQYAADGSFRLRIVDFEPATRTFVPLDSIVPGLVGLKVRRRFARFMRENRFRMRMKFSDDGAFLEVLRRLNPGKPIPKCHGRQVEPVRPPRRRIGIFTIFRCTNYGAVLQAIALRRVLGRMLPDADVEVIDHWMDPRDTHLLGKVTNPNTPAFQRWRNRRKFARRFLAPESFEDRREKTVALIKARLEPFSRVFRSPAELVELPPYETVVVGSDQVWNPGLNHDFPVNQYLCTEFPDDQRRVAYAASFGVGELPEPCREAYRAALGRFAAITVREESGAAICERLTGSRPDVALDPTMLLTADEWRELTECGGAEAGCDLAAYWVRSVRQEDVEALARVARERGCAVRLMSAGPLQKLDFPPEVKPCVDADPFDFVRIMAKASGVVTDSFHGLQFAVLFGRPFLALGDLSDPGSNAARLVDFCRLIGAQDGCAELSVFRSGGACRLVVAPEGFALAGLRTRSLELLKAMVGGGLQA